VEVRSFRRRSVDILPAWARSMSRFKESRHQSAVTAPTVRDNQVQDNGLTGHPGDLISLGCSSLWIITTR